jgi:hypothetical protein
VVVQVLGPRPEARRVQPEVQLPQAVRVAYPAAARLARLARWAVLAEAVHPAAPDADRRPAYPSAEVARMVRVPRRAEASAVQPLAAERMGALRPAEQPGASAGAVAEVPREEAEPRVLEAQPRAAPEVQGAAVGRQPAAESAGAARRREAAAERGVAVQRQAAARAAGVAVQPRAAARGAAVEVQPQAAVRAAGVVRRLGAGQVSEVLRRAARDARGARPLAVAWVAPLSTRLRGDRPAPSARARSAHPRRGLRTAQR